MLTNQRLTKKGKLVGNTAEIKKKKRKWPYILGGVIAAIVIAAIIVVYAVGNYLVGYAIGRSGDGGERNVTLSNASTTEAEKKIQEGRMAKNQRTRQFLESVKEEEVTVVSPDNLKLKGYYYGNDPGHKWVILVHGYRSDHRGMLGSGQRYHDHGYQVLIPDLRGCGKSEGDYIGMGWLDKDDILKWVDWINQRDSQAQIVIQGVSMGAATTVMTAGEKTPDSVKAFVEDSGYTTVWDVFSTELKLRFKLPSFPVLDAASAIADNKAGYNFKEASALAQVKKADKPMMFIHGTADNFIPFYMEKELYDNKPGENKKLLVAEGAGHVESAYLLGDEYWKSVFSFVDTYVK